jgi:hypothetical protein
MAVRYFISLPDPAKARGSDSALSFTAQGADGFAEQLQDALRTPALFERWRGQQADPDEVDPALGVTDASASVTGQQDDLHVDLVVSTSLPSEILKQRLRWLAGSGWQLRDVR